LQVQFSGNKEEEEENGDEGKVRLQTVHGSKGETHPYSYVVLDKFFFFSKDEMDEEYISDLYVLYVASTRARKEIHFVAENSIKVDWLFGENLVNGSVSSNGDYVEPEIKPNRILEEIFSSGEFYENYRYGKANLKLEYDKILKYTDKAVLFKFIDARILWLPKSVLGYDGDEVYVAKWIAQKNNII
jgi:ATP-dependent exoDNAse (exonuclease V) beta subunit